MFFGNGGHVFQAEGLVAALLSEVVSNGTGEGGAEGDEGCGGDRDGGCTCLACGDCLGVVGDAFSRG